MNGNVGNVNKNKETNACAGEKENAQERLSRGFNSPLSVSRGCGGDMEM